MQYQSFGLWFLLAPYASYAAFQWALLLLLIGLVLKRRVNAQWREQVEGFRDGMEHLE